MVEKFETQYQLLLPSPTRHVLALQKHTLPVLRKHNTSPHHLNKRPAFTNSSVPGRKLCVTKELDFNMNGAFRDHNDILAKKEAYSPLLRLLWASYGGRSNRSVEMDVREYCWM